MWGHHGSGREKKNSPDEVASEIADRLDRVTWSEKHHVVVLVPELEQWLWHCESALAAHCSIPAETLSLWVGQRASQLKTDVTTLKEKQPKELFEYIMRERLHRTVSPRDFEEIGKRGSVKTLMRCTSFSAVITQLRGWYPRTAPTSP
ncbi:MAG: hypothetical protein AB7G62_02430 [Magnetospirillum sp.]